MQALRHNSAWTVAAAALVLGMQSACTSFGAPASAGRPAETAGAATVVGTRAAEIALEQVGRPYRYGGRTPSGFDCSGLVQYAYRLAGKDLPRTTRQLWSALSPVPRDDIRVGDVLFFNVDGKMGHVGVYLGNERFVHAPATGRTVSVASLDAPYYDAALVRAGRPRWTTR